MEGRIYFTGYKEGIKVVSLVLFLKDKTGVSLSNLKSCVDDLLAGRGFYIEYPINYVKEANAIRIEATKLGAVCQLDTPSGSGKKMSESTKKKILSKVKYWLKVEKGHFSIHSTSPLTHSKIRR